MAFRSGFIIARAVGTTDNRFPQRLRRQTTLCFPPIVVPRLITGSASTTKKCCKHRHCSQRDEPPKDYHAHLSYGQDNVATAMPALDPTPRERLTYSDERDALRLGRGISQLHRERYCSSTDTVKGGQVINLYYCARQQQSNLPSTYCFEAHLHVRTLTNTTSPRVRSYTHPSYCSTHASRQPILNKTHKTPK